MRACKALFTGFLLALGCLSQTALAQTQSLVNDDTDLFRRNPNVAAQRPNVLIILDNTANWNQAFANEKSALVSTVNGLSDSYNVGLMMFDETGGGNQTNLGGYVRFGIRQMSFANKTALATMVGNLDIIGDKGNNADSDLAMFEAYLYFHALPSYSSWGQLKTDTTGNTTYNPLAAGLPGNAMPTNPLPGTQFNSPISSSCAKNYIIYISNGPANENSNELSLAQSFLQQISGQTPSIIPLSPSSQQSNWADEYARFMSTDTVPVITYTVDVNPSGTGMGPGWTAVLKSMASNGGGKYFAASDANGGAAIVAALQRIFTDVQAVNSVYAATSLPVSVNVRGTNIDQVYIGMFRPDENDDPRWYGNLKAYQLAIDSATGNLFLADAIGAHAENSTTGFITSTAQSFWTTGSSFWGFRQSSLNGAGGASDLPDGDLVEKGATAGQLRADLASDQSTRKLYTCTQGSYASCSGGSPLSATPFGAANTDITSAALGLGSNPVSPLTAYESKAVTAITDRLSVSLDNLAAPIAVTSLDNGGRSVSVTSLTTATPQAISSLQRHVRHEERRLLHRHDRRNTHAAVHPERRHRDLRRERLRHAQWLQRHRDVDPRDADLLVQRIGHGAERERLQSDGNRQHADDRRDRHGARPRLHLRRAGHHRGRLAFRLQRHLQHHGAGRQHVQLRDSRRPDHRRDGPGHRVRDVDHRGRDRRRPRVHERPKPHDLRSDPLRV